MAQLHPMFSYRTTSDKKVLTACLATERHEVGLKIVSDFLGLHGWQTYFTGANTPHFSILNLIETFQTACSRFFHYNVNAYSWID